MISIPADLPAQFSGAFSFPSLGQTIQDLTPVITILRETWDKETLASLQQGKVAVPDDVLNQYLKSAIGDDGRVKDLTVTTLGEGKMRITATTAQAGRIAMVCKVEKFEHDKNHSVFTLRMLDKKLPDKPLMSWIFSRVSLAMAAKFTGKLDFGPDVQVVIKGNSATVDFHQAIYNSRFGGLELFGYKVLDALIVKSAVPQQGYMEFETAIDMPEQVKAMIGNVLQ